MLACDDWIRATRPEDKVDGQPAYRWRYPHLEDLLARPARERPDLRAALGDRDPIVAANAAIGLARMGDPSAMEHLARAVRMPEMKLPIRLAAAEALGGVRQPSPVGLLRELIDQYGDRRPAARNHHPIPELHAELIRGLARHVDPADERRSLEALRSPAPEVRLEALQAWSAGRRGTLPVEATDLRADPDPRVRTAALGCIAHRRHPQARQYLAASLDDCNLQVRLAAVAALGESGGTEAQATLEGLLDDRAELIRAAAVSALAASGARQAVFDAADDESWRVRLEVARAMVRYPSRRGAALARQLIDDPNSMVRRQTIASLAEWPLQQAGPVLLAALGQTGYLTRKTAAGQLAALWTPATEFPVDGPTERRAEVLQQLERRFRQEVGFVDPEVLATAAAGPPDLPVSPGEIDEMERLIRDLSDPGVPEPVRRRSLAALAGFGPGLVEPLEQLALDRHQALPEAVYREVLPDCSPTFGVLDRLGSQDVSMRRRAAEELAELACQHPLGRLAMARLASLAVTETDQFVWLSVLTAIAADPSEPGTRLASAAISHPAPEVRRRACEHLAAHGRLDPEHAGVLVRALEDEHPLVVRAAVRALGASGRMDDTEPLRQLLLTPNDLLRLEAATALCRLGDPSGPPALERLSYSNDDAVRRQVAVAMGEIADPSFAPALVRLLDDHHGVCLAALEALPKVAGHDAAQAATPAPASLAERLDLWKRWFRGRESSVGVRTLPGGARE